MKKSILMVGALMIVSMVQADVISWRVYFDTGNSYFTAAELFSTTTGDTKDGTSASGGSIAMNPEYGILLENTTVSYENSISFFVKLYKSGSADSYSALKSWDTLVADGSLVSGVAPDLPATTAWNAVPEPTAMALLAMGLSALLLRRKRVA